MNHSKPITVLLSSIMLFCSDLSIAEDHNRDARDVKKAIERIEEIRKLPEKRFIETLDGQQVELNEFFRRCLKNWPHCSLYHKFYYWDSEVIETISDSSKGRIKHKVRIYCNCLSMARDDKTNPDKTHGDVAEFYDENEVFMGIAVYMGMGRYFSLPHSEYNKDKE
jgi:hypothetical protein